MQRGFFNDEFRSEFVRFSDLYGLADVGLDSRRLMAIASATGAAGITHTALNMIRLLGARVPCDLLDSLAKGCRGCVIGSDFLADQRWLFGSRELACGA